MKRSECRAKLGNENFRLLPSGEVSALLDTVVIHELGISFLRPAERSFVELIREHAYGNRDFDAPDAEEGELVFPVETSSRNSRVGQPIESHVVEDIVSRQAAGDDRQTLERSAPGFLRHGQA